jgi:putative integral membrane protein (TIGR02587 family)
VRNREKPPADYAGATAAVERSPERAFVAGLARAFAGAIIFSLPLLMTMEMWWFGFYMDRLRLAIFLVAFLPVLVGLSHYAGFEETDRWSDDVRDALVAVFVGFVTSAVVLTLAGLIDASMSSSEIVGKVALEAIPASVGASFAESQLGDQTPGEERKRRETGYGGELFLMAAGAIFFAFNIAPTEEMILIAATASSWHILAIAVTSLLLMHAFVYAVEFRGGHSEPEGTPAWSVFVRFTVVGYAVALLMSAYVLWTFGRFDESSVGFQLAVTIVLAFPASLGAAAARLVL